MTTEERYRLMFEQLKTTSEIRLKLFGWSGAAYAALWALFVFWSDKNDKVLIWVIPAMGVMVALIFWALDSRNAVGIGAAQSVGREIEAVSEIPKAQRYFASTDRGLSHTVAVMVCSLFLIIVCSTLAGYLFGIHGRIP